MQAEGVLRTVILEDAAVVALIGNRFFEELPQQPTFPTCTYSRVSRREPDEIPFPTVRLQVLCWATTRAGARAVATAIRNAVRQQGAGWKGVRHGTTVKYMRPENDLDIKDPTTGRHIALLDFKVTYREG